MAASFGLLAATSALADDGALVRKEISKAPGAPDTTPVSEAEHAFVDTMGFYVPSQASNGTVGPVDYVDADGDSHERYYARPLVSVFIYGPAEGVDGVGFVGHGKRDAYAAVSLDDGMTWKRTNLSESADDTSCDGVGSGGGCDVTRVDIDLFGDTDYAYPGDVVNVFQATAGQNALVVWPSRYCQGGSPSYSLTTSNSDKLYAIADYMDIDIGTDPLAPTNASSDDLYLLDMYGVAGSQGSVDYIDDKHEPNQAVGEVPYSCLWASRGTLVPGDDPRTDAEEESYMRWFKAERLTSGARDVNRVEASCVANAGCAITWQEDPEGLRGGQGEGPGEGWSGAVANSQTDVWYSYIDWDHFNLVEDPEDPDAAAIITLEDYEELAADDTSITQKPQVGIPFAMPMRVTDNAKCNVDNPKPYCNGSAIEDEHTDVLNPTDYGMVDMCEDTVEITTSGKGAADICVTEYGLPIVGNVAATRPRLGLFGYDSDADGAVDSAFAVFQAEESKGLGAFGFDADGNTCDPDEVEGCVGFDEGKNNWYYSFNFELNGDAAGYYSDKSELDSLLANLSGHGNQLNQPEIDWQTGEFYTVANTSSFWDFGTYNHEIWNTEIARRGSLLAQPIAKVDPDTSDATSTLIAMPAWKQGIMNQGGPADVMVRRILMPTGWDATEGNPYAFRNMDCDTWKYGRDGTTGMPDNPYYPDGLCMDSAINLSGSIPDTCTDSSTGGEIDCPEMDLTVGTFGASDTNPIMQGKEIEEPNTMKVLTWHQCPASYTLVSEDEDLEVLDCTTDSRTDASTLADQSWYNPLDVAKGHRGYLDGDFVMMLYAWSPTWRLNAKGSDRYELYIRRSFDGGETWTSLPASYTHYDGDAYSGSGTVSCETYRTSDSGGGDGGGTGSDEPHACYEYAAGAAEQARNVTQHRSTRVTTLDPRYAPTKATITADPWETGYVDSDEDTRDPSRYALVYETGDNTTTTEGEPEPDDLFYSRAVNFGDQYMVWSEEDDISTCYPSVEYDGLAEVAEELVDSGFCNEFDQLDQGTPGLQASEASLEANPGGEFIYAAWAQWLHDETVVDEGTEETTEDVDEDDGDWWDWGWDDDDDDSNDDDDDSDDDKDKKGKKDKDDDSDSDDDDDDDDDDDGDVTGGELLESAAVVRRVWLIDDYIPTDAWVTGGGGDGGGTTSETLDLFDFEDEADWSTGTTTTETTTSGDAALEVTAVGWTPIESDTFTGEDLTVTSTLVLDVFVPDEPPNPYWLGDVQVHVNCPDDGVYNAWVGREGFTGLELDTWHEIDFTLSSTVQSALGSANECTVRLNLNAPSGGDPFVFDNMRFE